MTLRKIILPFIVLAVAFAGSCDLYSTAPDDDAQDTLAISPGTIDVQEYFNEKLREGVIDRIGQPIEGFMPFMFLRAFSGLVPNDLTVQTHFWESTESRRKNFHLLWMKEARFTPLQRQSPKRA